ncbi:hypothetical protein [Nocardia sp. NPDC060249]
MDDGQVEDEAGSGVLADGDAVQDPDSLLAKVVALDDKPGGPPVPR